MIREETGRQTAGVSPVGDTCASQMAGMLAAQAASNSVYVQSQGYTRPGMGVPRDYTTTHGMHDHSKEEREWATTNRMVPGPPRRSLIGTSDRP